ncbi:MAG: hypothetical protein AB7U81_09150 [Thiohalomonadaceae bacterium]
MEQAEPARNQCETAHQVPCRRGAGDRRFETFFIHAGDAFRIGGVERGDAFLFPLRRLDHLAQPRQALMGVHAGAQRERQLVRQRRTGAEGVTQGGFASRAGESQQPHALQRVAETGRADDAGQGTITLSLPLPHGAGAGLHGTVEKQFPPPVRNPEQRGAHPRRAGDDRIGGVGCAFHDLIHTVAAMDHAVQAMEADRNDTAGDGVESERPRHHACQFGAGQRRDHGHAQHEHAAPGAHAGRHVHPQGSRAGCAADPGHIGNEVEHIGLVPGFQLHGLGRAGTQAQERLAQGSHARDRHRACARIQREQHPRPRDQRRDPRIRREQADERSTREDEYKPGDRRERGQHHGHPQPLQSSPPRKGAMGHGWNGERMKVQ